MLTRLQTQAGHHGRRLSWVNSSLLYRMKAAVCPSLNSLFPVTSGAERNPQIISCRAEETEKSGRGGHDHLRGLHGLQRWLVAGLLALGWLCPAPRHRSAVTGSGLAPARAMFRRAGCVTKKLTETWDTRVSAPLSPCLNTS